jgi:hypothetical protein
MLKIPVELRGRNAIHENFGGVISLIQTTSLGKKKSLDWMFLHIFEHPSIQRAPQLAQHSKM